ncbi:Flp pilus assembly protein CpaB [Thioalkalivibrio sp. ALE28]|uniref:Flp pilus assembly protein CpaB n=1 Tax=Thioalkalivibrio sp. ALE28 TaxID=1158179 RepID=UPI0004771F67|nr:Flp pilus assembly protein CpaB [Thioalkalivibrio sp. ALE28]
MNSRVLIALAGLFLLSALVLAWAGILISQHDKPDQPSFSGQGTSSETEDGVGEAVVAEPGTPVVFAARDLEPGTQVTADDLYTEHLRSLPPLAFSDKEEVVGLTTAGRIRSGELLLEGRFFRASQLTRSLRPGERAVAIQVDDVVGAGGYLAPDDRVDVLLYLDSRGGSGVAQRVHEDLRVLAYGSELSIPPDGMVDTEDEAGERRQRGAQTAVLAVPLEQATTLMLADRAGVLRLAARPSSNRRSDFDADAFVAAEEAVRGERLPMAIEELKTPGGRDDRVGVDRAALEPLTPQPAVETEVDGEAAPVPPVFLHRGVQRESVRPSQD